MLLLVCFSSISRWCWIRSFSSLGAGVDCRAKFRPLEIVLTSSLIRLEDRLSWQSSSNRSTCSSSSLRRVISSVRVFNIDDAVLWCGCCLITSSESFLSSVSWAWNCWSSKTVIGNSFSAPQFSQGVRAVYSLTFLSLWTHWWQTEIQRCSVFTSFVVAFLQLTVDAVGEEARYWWWKTALRTGATQFFDVKKLSKVWMLIILNFSCSKEKRRNVSQTLMS